jgi:hypothetical protein
MEPKTKQPPGSERARDEQREGGPRYGGEAWEVADERGENRFGHARNDDADPLELVKASQEDQDEAYVNPPGVAPKESANDDGLPTLKDMQNAAEGAPHVESGGEAAGMGRGEKPRKPKARSKK